MIRFTHVTKRYPKGGPAIDDVSFHVNRGEFVFLTGPSGAGKSTILKMVYVEERPSAGEVKVAGFSSAARGAGTVSKLRRRLGVGNSTGLGMAPFLVTHALLVDRWITGRETALARRTADRTRRAHP